MDSGFRPRCGEDADIHAWVRALRGARDPRAASCERSQLGLGSNAYVYVFYEDLSILEQLSKDVQISNQ